MAGYRVPEFTAEQRADVALRMLLPFPDRRWGLAPELARLYGVSRPLLDPIRDRAWKALTEALLPREAGRPAQTTTLTVDKALVDRAIGTLPLLKGSVRDIRLGRRRLLGVPRSVGDIRQTLTAAGAQAETENGSLCGSLPILGEAAEIFQGRPPCLPVVDGRSFLVVHLTPAESRDGTTWGVTYLDLLQRGIRFQDRAGEGGKGRLAGVREAQLAIPLRPDLFHLLREAGRLTQRLEEAAYKAIATAERARRAAQEAQGQRRRRRGRPLQVQTPLSQAEVQEAQAVATFDAWCWLLGEIRQALKPITPAGRLVPVAEAQATLETAIAWLKELGHPQIMAFADDLQEKMRQLLAPLEWLEPQRRPVLQGVDPETQAFLRRARQHRQELNLDVATDIPQELQAVVSVIWDILGLFPRSSGLAESLHRWLRPHLQIHRGMCQWLLPLWQLFWNPHKFERGKRAGPSPLELAGVADAPSLEEVLDRLVRPAPAVQPA
jgi:hypothetical protein